MKVIESRIKTRNDHVLLKVLADAHIGSNEYNLTAFKKEIDEIKDNPDMYCGINGDILDNITPNGKFNPYDEDSSPQVQLALAIRVLEPIKDKIIFITRGNHESRSWKTAGIDPCEFMAETLGIPDRYSPFSCLVFLTVTFVESFERRATFTIFASHGNNGGGGRRVGSKANAVEDMSLIVPQADLYIHSHSHQAMTFKDSYFELDKIHKKTIKRTRTYLNTGAYLNYGGYGEDRLYKVPAIISPVARFSLNRRYFTVNHNGKEQHDKEISIIL